MATKNEAIQELGRRGALPSAQQAAFNEIQRREQPSDAPESFLTKPAAIAETVAGIGTGLAGLTAGGVAGIGTLVTGGGFKKASENIQKVQEFFTREPTTQAGQETLRSVGEAMENIVRTIEGGVAAGTELRAGLSPEQAGQTFEEVKEKGIGDVVFERTGSPAAATAAGLGVDVAAVATPLKGFKGVARKGTKPFEANQKPTPAQKSVIKSFADDEIPLQEGLANLETIGEGAVIADVGGANVRGIAKSAGSITRKGRDLKKGTVIERSNSNRGRMVDMLNKTLFKGKELITRKKELFDTAIADADVFYNGAYAAPVEATDSLINILTRPAITQSGIIKDAEKLIRFMSEKKLTAKQRELGLSMFDGKGGIVFENINMVGLDHIKRALNQKAGGTKLKKGELSTAFKDHATDLRQELVGQVQTYDDALATWTNLNSGEAALQAGRDAFKSVSGNTKGVETLIEEFNLLSKTDQSLYRLGAADYLRGAIRSGKDTAKAKQASSVITSFTGGPAHRELLSTIFEDANQFKMFEALVEKERTFSRTAEATTVSEGAEVRMQELLRKGNRPEKIAAMATDALFAANNNRFAVLRLIQDTFKLVGKKGARKKAEGQAGILFDPKDAKSQMQEMINIVGSSPKSIQIAMKMSDTKLINWLRSKQNRRALLEFGARAAVIERSKEN